MSDVQNETPTQNGAAKAPYFRATPEMDVFESASEYLIVLDVPGATPDSVNVQVLGSELRVRAEQAASAHAGDVALAAFERRIELAGEVDANSAVAELRDGVLEIRLQKSVAARRVKIPVNAN
jgi:HSP20 family protein